MASFNWDCPYCNRSTTITTTCTTNQSDMIMSSVDGYRRLQVQWIVCPNQDCQRLTLYTGLFRLSWDDPRNKWSVGDNPLKMWRLLPESKAKVLPSYIPRPIVNDYEEAMAILELSPKASATLARRCLQGMIRDYWRVSKGSLFDEINAIEDKVDPLVWKSIDAVRKVGNIGAHMEKDINTIIDVDPKEATLLTELLELLFEEWYVHRHEREQKLNSLVALAENKKTETKKTG